MFVSHFTHVFSQYPDAQMGIIFHHEGEVITHVNADPSVESSDFQFKEIFKELGHTFPLIGEFKEGIFETDTHLWLIYPLTTSLKIGLIVQKESIINQARFWLNELRTQIQNAL